MTALLTQELATARISAICAESEHLSIKEMPAEQQIQICEMIIRTHPDRQMQLWARSLYLELTNPEPDDAP